MLSMVHELYPPTCTENIESDVDMLIDLIGSRHQATDPKN